MFLLILLTLFGLFCLGFWVFFFFWMFWFVMIRTSVTPGMLKGYCICFFLWLFLWFRAVYQFNTIIFIFYNRNMNVLNVYCPNLNLIVYVVMYISDVFIIRLKSKALMFTGPTQKKPCTKNVRAYSSFVPSSPWP